MMVDDIRPGPGGIRPYCESEECQAAQVQLQIARSRILTLCSDISQQRARIDFQIEMQKFLMQMFAVLMAAAVVAAFIPYVGTAAAIILGAVAMGVLATMFAWGLKISSLQKTLMIQEKMMTEARAAFDEAVASVMRDCPQPCWAGLSLDQPLCP